MLDEAIVEIFSTKMCVSCCGLDLKHTLVNGQQGDIKGATTQIKDEDVLLPSGTLLIQTCMNFKTMRISARMSLKPLQRQRKSEELDNEPYTWQ